MGTERHVSVVIADDEPVVREGLRLILETQRDLCVVGSAGDGLQAVRQCAERSLDVLLLDVRMPQGDGLWVLAELARRGLLGHGGCRVLMLTTFSLDEYVDEALAGGASGFLLKSSSYEEVLAGVRAPPRGRAS